MADNSSFWKGVGRALGPDTVGWPVDTAQDVINLLLAGGGTAAHKLGLINAEQLPSPLKGSPGTSDWWAKHTNVPDDGSGQYLAGRLSPLAVALAPQAAKAVPALIDALAAAPQGKAGQRGAIRVGGREDLMPSHQTSLGPLLTNGGQARDNPLPLELYSPSIGITKDSLMSHFGGGGSYGDFWAIPRIGAFDPAYSPTTLFNRDAYTKRSRNYEGKRADDWGALKRALDPNRDADPETAAALMGKKRVQERLNIRDPEAVALTESFNPTTGDFAHDLSIHSSPAFRSFAQFERDPRGAANLDRHAAGLDPSATSAGLLYDMNSILRQAGLMGSNDFSDPRNLIDYLGSKSRGLPADDPQRQMIVEALMALQQAQKGAGRVPSEYAELKAHGPITLGPDRFAGVIVRPSSPLLDDLRNTSGYKNFPEQTKALQRMLEQADQRGMGKYSSDWSESNTDLFEIAKAMQQEAGPVKDRSFREQKYFPAWSPDKEKPIPKERAPGTGPKEFLKEAKAGDWEPEKTGIDPGDFWNAATKQWEPAQSHESFVANLKAGPEPIPFGGKASIMDDGEPDITLSIPEGGISSKASPEELKAFFAKAKEADQAAVGWPFPTGEVPIQSKGLEDTVAGKFIKSVGSVDATPSAQQYFELLQSKKNWGAMPKHLQDKNIFDWTLLDWAQFEQGVK